MPDRLVVGGFTAPQGTRKLFGALLLGLYSNSSLIYVGRTGGGFDDRMLAQAYDEVKPLVTETCPFKEVPAEVRKSTWIQPQLVCEVRFNEWTSDRKLRAPIFQGFRDDVDAKECLLEDALPKSSPGSRFARPASPSGRRRRREARAGKGEASVEAAAEGLISSANPDNVIPFTNLDKVFWPEDG